MNRRIWNLLLMGALLVGMLYPLTPSAAASSPARREPGVVVLDGAKDSSYVRIAEDPRGDLGDPSSWEGTRWADLTELYVTADATTLYVYASLPVYTTTVSSGQIGLVLDVDGHPYSGGTQDPGGNAITFEYNQVDGAATPAKVLPDYVIRGNLPKDGGVTDLYHWNGTTWEPVGSNWGGITDAGSGIEEAGTQIAYQQGGGVEFAIPLSTLGISNPAAVHLQLFATQGGGGKGAFDTVPPDSQSTGWDGATTQYRLVSVPVAVDPAGDLLLTGYDGVHWTDFTRLHIWADHANLHLFIPMAYTQTVSVGQLGMAIDTKAGGGSGDAWGNGITFAYTATMRNLGATPVETTSTILPDYLMRGNIFGAGANGWTELRAWNGSDWNTGGGIDWGGIGNSGQPSQPGSKVAWSNGEGLRLTIPFADLGAAAGNTINLEFFGFQGGGSKGAYDTLPSDNQATGWDTPTTQKFLATYRIPTIALPRASHNNVIWMNDLAHDSRDDRYRTPGGAVVTGTAVTLRLRAASGDLTGAKVRIYDDRQNSPRILSMKLAADDGTYEWWEITVPASEVPTIYWYRFIAIDGTAAAYYDDDAARTGGLGQAYGESPDRGWQLTVYTPDFETPDWIQNAVVYQIFPDRFRDGDATNNLSAGTFFYNEVPGTITRSLGVNWNTVICDPRGTDSCAGTYSKNFYGGDLAGIQEKLDYLQSLGVTAIYLNPIFESPSNHKYDATDYNIVDDNFGDQATFVALAQELHSRGMHLILDGVFNHTSSDSIYFDRYGRYDAVGACESVASPYRSWYYFRDVTPGTGTCVGSNGLPNAATYESWFGYDSLPKLRANDPQVRALIWSNGTDSVAPYWMQWADGWRLDVGGDVDPGITGDASNDYWEGFRAATHAENPETYIVGEEWGNATPWTLGPEWDATMNYQFGSAILSFWRDETFVDNDHNENSSAGTLSPLLPSQLDARLHYLQERYPAPAFYAMMNLLDSHDTNRALFMLDHNTEVTTTNYRDPNYDWSDAINRLRGVVLLQMTMPGAPTVYYGDEVGLVGPPTYSGGKWEDDPYNRMPFPWLDASGTPYYTHLQSEASQSQLRDYYKKLISIRNAHPALRTGSFDTLLVDDEAKVYVYGRKLISDTLSDAAVVLINRSSTARSITVPVEDFLSNGIILTDVLNGGTSSMVSEGRLTVANVPPMSGAILVLESGDITPPGAPTGLTGTEGATVVQLTWNAVPGADRYYVYRSLVSGGGYTRIITGNSTTSFPDDTVTPGTWYYYVVTAVDLAGNEGPVSNEVAALPHYTLNLVMLDPPLEITHTLGIAATEPLSGEAGILGVTEADGPTDGLLAQVGFGLVSQPAISWTTWVDAPYSGQLGGHFGNITDKFTAALVPEQAGEFYYLYRFSTTHGRDWIYAGDNGAFDPTVITDTGVGKLHVLPSGDSTAPAAPQGLQVSHWGADHITLAWNAVTDPDLHAYDLYRYGPGQTAGQAQRVARIMAPSTVYTDMQVEMGNTYTYTVKALDTSFNNSAASNAAVGKAEPRMVEIRFLAIVPTFTPEDDLIYIAGDNAGVFGGSWSPGATAITRLDPTHWIYTGTVQEGTELQYKYTRSSWDMVENWGTLTGTANRHLVVEYGTTGVMTQTDTVYNWRDPLVTAVLPSSFSVPAGPQIIRATFNRILNTARIDSESLVLEDSAGTVYSGTFAFATIASEPYITQTAVTFTPTLPLPGNRYYTVTLAKADFVGAEEGILMQDGFSWSFQTEAEPQPEISIDKTVALPVGTVRMGDPVTYTIVVYNTGNADATAVRIVDQLPAELVGASLDVTRPVAAGGAVTFTVPATVRNDLPAGTNWITNTATAFAEVGQIADEVAFPVVVAPAALSIQKTVALPDGVVRAGDPVTYSIVVRNSGEAVAEDVRITDALPAGLVGESLDVTRTVAAGGAITLTVPAAVRNDLPVGTTWITNTATYVYGTAQESSFAAFQVNVAAAAISLQKTVELPDGVVRAGAPVTYTIVVRNSGDVDAQNVRIEDVLPVGLVGASLDVTRTVVAGGAVTLTVPATVVNQLPSGTIQITNIVTCTYGGNQGTAEASFQWVVQRIYLPLVVRNNP